ncbi:unnamed protein product [Clonostachys rosea f. rosea IK726]|uniref:Uncharacterized protein n=2 Tax=Bionectria ochroleuca TaxID=29856 RepID=A0A0B7K433_BIOOC|nr:unnamed protein product [Clonostachys rosea f. rosea IK726]
MPTGSGAHQSSHSTASLGGKQDSASVGGAKITTSCASSPNHASGTPSASKPSSTPSHQGSALLAGNESADNAQTSQLSVGQEDMEDPIGKFLSETDRPFAVFRDANGTLVTVGRDGPSMAQTIDSILNPTK